MIDFNIDIKGIATVQRFLKEAAAELRPAIAEAANRAAAGAKTDAKRLIAKQYPPLKIAEIAQGISVYKSEKDAESPGAVVAFRGPRLSQFRFSPRPSKVMGGRTKGGVSSLIAGARIQAPHAFIAKVRGELNIFQRQKLGRGSDRRKLRLLTVWAIPEMVEDEVHEEAILNLVREKMLERFEIRFLQQVDRYLKQLEKK